MKKADISGVLKDIVNQTHDAVIYIDDSKRIQIINSNAARLCGTSAEEAIGKRVEEVVVSTRLPYVLETGQSEVNRRQEFGNVEIITSRMPIYSGDKIIGAVAIFRDISEMVNLVEEVTNLKELQMTMEAILNSTKDAISVVNTRYEYLFMNDAFTRITGYNRKEVMSGKYADDFSESGKLHKRVLDSGKSIDDVITKSKRTGKHLVVSGSPVIVDGEIKGSVAIFRDVTEINKLDKELAQAKSIIRNLEAKYTFSDIKGDSLAIRDAVDRAKIAAVTPATVVLRGESGTGKELFAHAIHNSSNRKSEQFLRANCTSFSESLLESELFGYEEGAFTGAKKGGHRGLFERASGGTVFLDEIGEINLSTQIKLLRVIQEKEIMRVGSTKPISVDVRLISATHIDLEKAVREGRFRQDLYYRLNVIPIQIPPLRDRLEDLRDLVSNIIGKFNREYGRNVMDITDDAFSLLQTYHWPGNIRELENYIGRTMIQMKISENTIQRRHMGAFDANRQSEDDAKYSTDFLNQLELSSLSEKMLETESTYIKRVLSYLGDDKKKAAEVLGISLRTLYYKLNRLQKSN